MSNNRPQPIFSVRQLTPAHSQCQTADPSTFSVCQTTDPSPFSVQTPAYSQCITVRQQSPAHSQSVRQQSPAHSQCQTTDPSPLNARLQPTVSVSDDRCQPSLRMSDNRPQPTLSKSGSPNFHPCSSVVDLALGSCTKSMQSHSAACLQYKGNKSMSCMETLSRETA